LGPDKPPSIADTADAACGGKLWVSTFMDSFRSFDQHGRLAGRGVRVITHNALASRDYRYLSLANRPSPEPRVCDHVPSEYRALSNLVGALNTAYAELR
jgi:hypothetical protein